MNQVYSINFNSLQTEDIVRMYTQKQPLWGLHCLTFGTVTDHTFYLFTYSAPYIIILRCDVCAYVERNDIDSFVR